MIEGAPHDQSIANIQLKLRYKIWYSRHIGGSAKAPADLPSKMWKHSPVPSTVRIGSSWLTLFPTDGWTRSFPIRWFSDQPKPYEMGETARLAGLKARGDASLRSPEIKEAAEKVSAKEISTHT